MIRIKEERPLRTPMLLLMLGCLLFPVLAMAQEEESSDVEDLTYELVDAVYDENLRDVRRLLGDGADANAMTLNELPIIGYASMKGLQRIVQALVEAGADVEAKDLTGATALMYAGQFGNNEIVESLIEAGADVDAADSLGWTAAIRAVVGENLDGVTTLKEAGADFDAADYFGRTALQIAEGRDSQEIVSFLTGGS